MLDWHSCQVCCPLEIKVLLLSESILEDYYVVLNSPGVRA